MATLSEIMAIAIRHHQASHFEAAETIYRHVVSVEPGHAEAWNLLGVVAHQVGRHEVAVEHFGQAISLKADDPRFYNNLGEAYRGLKKVPEAIAAYERALAIQPDLVDVHYNLGNALKDARRPDEAIASYRRALAIRPEHTQTLNNLGNTLLAERRAAEAIVCFERALELQPNLTDGHNNLALALQELNRPDEAIAAFHRVLQLDPRNFAANTNLGSLLAGRGEWAEAMAWYRRALQHNPENAEAYYNLGYALKRQGRLSEAESYLRQAIARRPVYAEAQNNLGVTLKDQGRIDEAVECYRRALEADGNHAAAHSNLLLALQYRPGVTLQELAAVHVPYQEQHAAKLRSAWREPQHRWAGNRPLRLGFLSPDLRCHPVGYFLIRILENLNSAECEKFCYYDRRNQDPIAARFEAAATVFRNVTEQSDDVITEQIREDRIDILFDLAGHTGFNRLLVFARRPAPVQITWLGYEGTTGLDAIDYILADRYTIPEKAEPFYCEKVLRMPHGYVCYDPPTDAPAVGSLPAAASGSICFGSFNNLAKINFPTVEAWSEVLRGLPGSRMMLKYHGFDDAGVRSRYLAMFSACGIAADRLELLPPGTHAEYLAAYGQVDVALDPFPFGGGITTCDALWMGVPVVTLPGETFASRHSMSHLANAGLAETIAHDREDYVARALSLARDVPRLVRLRAELRGRVAASPLCDGRAFASELLRILSVVAHGDA